MEGEMRQHSLTFLLLLLCGTALGQQKVTNVSGFLAQCGVKDSKIISPDVLLRRHWSTNLWEKTSVQAVEGCADCDVVSASRTSSSGNAVWITESSESGDWMRQNAYCYDNDGKLLVAASVFRHVNNWAVVQLYDVASGDSLRKKSELFTDLDGNPIKRPSQAGDYQQLLTSIPSYIAMRKLPFAGFITPREKTK
jgi:hypothetical protein